MASIYAASSLLKFSPSDTENTVSKLFVGPEKSDLPFTSNADFFCFCAALGKKYKRSSEITEKSGSDFSGQVDEETFVIAVLDTTPLIEIVGVGDIDAEN